MYLCNMAKGKNNKDNIRKQSFLIIIILFINKLVINSIFIISI